MSDEITRVARAIAERALISSRHPWPAPDHPDWLDLACAAIDAMTSPNDQPVVEPANIERLRARVAELEFRLTPRRPTMPDPVARPRRAKEAKP